MSRMLTKSVFVLLAVTTLGLGGCAQQSQPSNFYLLSYEPSQAQAGQQTTMRNGLALGIGPIEFPQYLDRPQIVTRDSANHLILQEFSRWGGRLKGNFTSVLAEALSDELESDRVSIYPWNLSAPVEYQVTVQVSVFEADTAGASVLEARWSVVDVKQQKVRVMARSSYRQAAEPAVGVDDGAVDYEAVAAAMSRDVAALASEIAERIKSLSGS